MSGSRVASRSGIFVRRGLPAVVAVVALTAASCSSSKKSTSTTSVGGAALTDVTVLMPGSLSSAVGGYVDPAVTGIAAKHGITIHFQLAGQGVFNTIPQVASGQAPFSLSDTADIFIARSKNIPVVEIYAGNDDPTCIMYHPNSGISTIADLNGKTIAVTPGASYWLYLKKKYNITNAHEVQYTGSIASFASDSTLSQQCFYTNEPFQATEQKIAHSVFLVSETGWASYSDTLFTTTSEVSSHADVVRNLVQAFEDGWKDYLANPQAVFTYLAQQGDKETPAQMSYVQNALKTKFNAGKLGNNDPTRMKDVATQLQGIGLLPSTFDYTSAFTNSFMK